MICRDTTDLFLVQISNYGLCETHIVEDALWHMNVCCEGNDMQCQCISVSMNRYGYKNQGVGSLGK